jgi:RimJ/RimL family protein N-acetyltransferase
MKIPTLETERLRLRPHRPEDLADCTAMWADASVTRYIGGRPFSREEVWARLLRYAGHWRWMGYGFWVIEERSSERFVGEIGLADFKRDMEPPLNIVPEAGWALAPRAHGHGFATEALLKVASWNDLRTAGSLTCVIHPDNSASIKVAAKCGFKEARRTFYKGALTSIFIRPSRTAE